MADTGGAVLPYAGNFLAVGGFSFFGGIDVGRSGKPKYGGIFPAVCGCSFFDGNVNVNSKLGGRCGA